MTITDTYRIHEEWGSLVVPLMHKLQKQNGTSLTPLDKLHNLALTKFQNTLPPGRKNEDWKYTPLREVLNTSFAEPGISGKINTVLPSSVTQLEATRIVFINSHFAQHLSDPLPDGISLTDLQEATQILERIIARLEVSGMTPFEALTTSITTPGVCLTVAPEVDLALPLHFIYVTDLDDATPVRIWPYKLINVGRNASIDIVESFTGLNSKLVSFTNSVNHIMVENGAHLRHARLQDEGKMSNHINMTRVFQEKDSTYSSIAVELGGKLVRNNIEVIHRGTGITSNVNGLFMAEEHQHMDTQTFIDHAHPHCESHELYKGILDGYARGVFNGKIIVRPDAQKTNAFQQNNALVLSRNAVMDSKPQLEIFADDVKCSHGATIGQLDENAMFYLRSRGLTKSQASALLQRAFVGEVLDMCTKERVRNYLNQNVETRHHV